MSDLRCAVPGCSKVGGIWQGWVRADGGIWVCADHYPIPEDEYRELKGEADESPR